jgi:Uma2 family endonuclease
MVQANLPSLTLENFLQLLETKPASEYIDGQIIQKPLPQGEHSTLQRDLTHAVDSTLKPLKIARAFPELRCTFGGRSLVPDITVFQWDRIPRQENGRIANAFNLHPDWTIEILSPGQSQTKVTRNILHCLKNGTEIGWLIDPEESCVFVYRPDQTPDFFDQPQLILPVPSWATAVEITVEQLFGWLMD